MPDLGKSIRWPAPPVVLAPFVGKLKVMHQRWRAAAILATMPQHLRDSLPQKLAAFAALSGKRERWGYTRPWKGDYLAQNRMALFVIHVAENDIVGCAKNAREEERIGELVGTLLAQYEKMKMRPPMVIVSPTLSVCLGGKTRVVRIFPADPTQQAVFKKNGNDIDLICHTMSAA
ncbi:hypothetical protein OSTOST_17669 [Ostertagia ostertagi]